MKPNDYSQVVFLQKPKQMKRESKRKNWNPFKKTPNRENAIAYSYVSFIRTQKPLLYKIVIIQKHNTL
jgi:hypothetical protein